jgi:DNA-binding GntR family transcriptional regulator
MGRRGATQPIEATTRHGERAEHTYERLLALVVRGRLKPGERVPEAELALKFGVSRTPVREALDRLEHEGYLVPSTAGRRTQLVVAPLTETVVRELWTLIGAIEGVAILAIAAMGRDRRRQLAASMAEVNDALADQSARRPMDVDRVSELMSEFHQVFMDACAARHTLATYKALRPHVQRYEWAYGSRSGARFKTSILEHRQIIDAVGRGDAARARSLLERHWAAGIPRTTELLRQSR